jgi:HK97 family phage portal protein
MWPFRRTKDRALFNIGDIPVASTWSGVPVNPDTALRLSAVWSCVQLLSGSISTLPLHVYREGEREPLPTPLLLRQPAARTPLPDFLHATMVSLLLRGNAYAVVVARSGASMLPAQVELAHPDQVAVRLTDDGIEYRVGGRVVDRDDIWHVKGFCVPGSLVGLSPVEYARQAIGLGLAQERYGAQWFGSGSIPAGILRNTQKTVHGPAAEEVKARFKETVEGRDVFVTGADWQYTAISIAPEDSQFVESRKFQIGEVARLFGVPAEMIGGDPTGSHTYTSVEQRSAEFLTYSLRVWLTKLEVALARLLPRNQFVKFNAGGLLRTDLKTRYESYRLGLEGGWLTLDEVRQLEDLPPLPTTEEAA